MYFVWNFDSESESKHSENMNDELSKYMGNFVPSIYADFDFLGENLFQFNVSRFFVFSVKLKKDSLCKEKNMILLNLEYFTQKFLEFWSNSIH